MKIKELPSRPSEGKGRVLALKEGYNPNSSSLGSIVFSYPEAWLLAPVIAGTVSAAATAWFTRKNKKENPQND
ncbi:MAG: hypothetical protein KAU94_04380 [Verrucomicrobia bacterium]|nr:hypothetical protein [Verrucomicrobiota bacterium]